jgi:hypothetical protein
MKVTSKQSVNELAKSQVLVLFPKCTIMVWVFHSIAVPISTIVVR